MDTKDLIQARIKRGRSMVIRFFDEDESVPETYATDQYLKKPQPPLAKAAMTDNIIDLPKDFSSLDIRTDFLGI